MKKKNLIRIAIVVGIILLIPLFGNIFVDGWNWNVFDFIIMGALLFGTGLLLDFAVRKITNPLYRIFTCAIIVLLLIALWSELAVDVVSQMIDVIF